VRDDEGHQHEAADAHDVLLPEGRMPDFHQKIHEAAFRKRKFEFIVRGRLRQTGPAKPCKYKERGFSSADA
jgi:hypothetical protein